jgi:GABA(A) receptor-associated protein
MSGNYKSEKTFEQRQLESQSMIERYPDRVPVIVTPSKDAKIILDKRKFMVPKTVSCAQFAWILRRRMGTKLLSSEAMFIFVNNRLLNPTQLICETYSTSVDADGFLYLVYGFENTFG